MTKAEQLEALRQRRITVGFNRMLAPEPDIGTELVATEKLLLAVNRHPSLNGRTSRSPNSPTTRWCCSPPARGRTSSTR